MDLNSFIVDGKEEKFRFLSSYNLLTDQYEIGMNSIGWNLLAVLRIVLAEPIEMPLWCYIFDDKIISPENEIKVWQFLLQKAKEKLTQMNTSLAQDQQLLEAQELSKTTCFMVQSALLWRINKKSIWTNLQETAQRELNKYL